MLIPRLLLCCQSVLHCHDVIYARVAISGVWRQTLAIVANGIRGTRSCSHSSISSHYRPTDLVGICDLHRERHRIDHIYHFSRFCQVLFYLIGGSGPSAPVYQISATRPCLCCSTTIYIHVSFWRAFVFFSCSCMNPSAFAKNTHLPRLNPHNPQGYPNTRAPFCLLWMMSLRRMDTELRLLAEVLGNGLKTNPDE